MITSLSFWYFKDFSATKAEEISTDAIAIRVMPNSEHFSPLRWYRANVKNQGSPQNLLVDGYEAIRDGRTVYVNAANISGTDFYTNVYIISYNQEAENQTIDIFGQILTHWKFNVNVPEEQKDNVRNDTKRLADLAEIKLALNNYQKIHNGDFPFLTAGSYLAGKSISTWPSWQATLGKALGATLPIDPINKLGTCPGYDDITCWNQNNKTFADPNPNNNILELPADSYVYVYTTDASGGNYDVCAVMESGYLTELAQGACQGSKKSVKVGGQLSNKPPVINCSNLTRLPQKEFKGYVSAYDPDAGDFIVSWKITDQQVAGWQPLELKSTAVANQKEIYSVRAGDNGNYSFTLEVGDSRGAKVSATCSITICGDSIITLSDGVGDGVVYDNNNNTNSAANVNGGSYLKLGAVMPTPYIWIANTDINKVAKIRTFDGKKRNCARNNGKVRCWWEDGTWETMGQLIGTYSVGTDPSRTAVNVETGDVWIGNRAGGSVTKLDINGNILKTCLTGAMVRGVIIDKDGDIWVSNYNSGTVVKISGDDTNCAILTTVNLGAGYGLTMDSENNVWVAHVGGGASKINTSNNYAITKFPAAGGYGITVDMYDNVWLGGYPSNNALVKFTKGSSDPKYFGPGYQGLGVSTDLGGNIWAGTYTANGVVKVDQNGNSLFGLQPNGVTFIQKNSGGSDAHGICGDSQNNIWVVNYGSGNTRVFNSNGDTLGTFNVYKTGEPSKAYTYSDMTGLNRAMIFRSGVWMSKVFDGGSVNQHWGKIEWQETVPADTTVEMSIRTSDDNVNWTEYDASQWNNLDLGDRRARYLQIQATLRSNKRGETPVIWGIKLK